MLLRQVKKTDLEEIRVLNESVLPHVNSISITDFEVFMKIASFFMVAEIEGEITAFIIVLGPEQSYESENYRFFSETFESFDYVDRIVVGDKFQGKGIGKTLYKYLINNSGEQRITCEVNLKPPNPGSILFHEKMGFKEVGQQFSEGGKKWVSLMCRVKETL